MAARYPLEWTFHLDVNTAWFESFAGQFSGIDVALIADTWDAAPTQYRWSSPHLNGLADPTEIGSRAAALKALYDGAMLVHRLGDYHPARLKCPVEHLKADVGDFQLSYPFEPFSPHWPTWSLQPFEDPSRHPVSLFIFLAHFSRTAKDMLIFLGANGLSWVTLYALRDFMKDDGWDNETMAASAGVCETELKRFTRTANNFAAIGPFARHGELGWEPPKVPMTLNEARSLVLGCVDKFLHDLAMAQALHQKFQERCA